MQPLANTTGDHGEDEDTPRLRRLPVPGTWGYLSRTGVAAGGHVSVHVSAEADHEIELLRLGRRTVLDPAAGLDADRAEAEVLERWSRPAAPQTIGPGSFVVAGAPPEAESLTAGLWLRLWALPVVDVVQVAFAGLISDTDYPDTARFALLVDHLGLVGVYAGDSGPFRHAFLRRSSTSLGDRIGRWTHVAATVTANAIIIYIDGLPVARFSGALLPAPPDGARLCIGAMVEGGAAGNLLDADIAQPFLSDPLDDTAIARLAGDRARRPLADVLPSAHLHAAWPLDEEAGVHVKDESGKGRHGTIVNHGTWMIGGPAFNADRLRPESHVPDHEPNRGHGLRLSSDDLMDPGWPASVAVEIPADADSGVYGVRVRLTGQPDAAALTMPLVVTRRRPRHPGAIAVLAATNTWHAYGRRPTNELAVYGLTSSYYSRHRNGRPFFHLGLRMPMPLCDPFRYESDRAARTRSTHLVRTERHLEAWLAREGYAFEMITDEDLDEEPDLLRHFRALAIVGHSEYWSDRARDGLAAFLDGGGQVLCLSGDTLSVRVSYDADRSEMECRKIVYDDDPRWLAPALWGESWHSHDRRPGGSFRRMGQPAFELLGLSFKGMIDDGTVSSFGSYTVLEPDHPLMRDPYLVTPDGDGRIGTRSLNGSGGASGYEFDATPERTRTGPHLPGMTILASAIGQRNIEWLGEPDHGADLVLWERPSGGTIINFGSIAAAGALSVDEAMGNLARNALARFGVERRPESVV